MVKSREFIFPKSQKLLTERALSELHGGGLFRTFNSYSFNFVRAIVSFELPAREASNSVIFEN